MQIYINCLDIGFWAWNELLFSLKIVIEMFIVFMNNVFFTYPVVFVFHNSWGMVNI